LKYFRQRVRIERREDVGIGDNEELLFQVEECLTGDPGGSVRLQAPLEDLDDVGRTLERENSVSPLSVKHLVLLKGGGGGLAVSAHALYFKDLNSNPTDVWTFIFCNA